MRASEPSERDVEIFRAVRFGEMSHRQAAAKWEVSPTRVGQILAEVESWYRASAALVATRYNPRQELFFEFRLHTERLDMLMAKALAECEEKKLLPGDLIPTKHVNARLIAVAMRLSAARFAAVGALHLMLARLSPKEQQENRALEPPAGGCAPSAPNPAQPAAVDDRPVVASDSEKESCIEQTKAFSTNRPSEMISPSAQVGAPPALPSLLSRKQRKRLLERKLRAT